MTKDLRTRPPNVFVGVPMYSGAWPAPFKASVDSLMAALSKGEIPCGKLKFQPNVGDADIRRARNKLAGEFLAGDWDQFVMIDSDIVFRPAKFAQLLNPDHLDLIVGGIYRLKSAIKPRWCLNTFRPWAGKNTGLLSCKAIGTGFLRIPRLALEAVAAGHEYECFEGWGFPEFDIFRSGVFEDDGKRRYLSEDFAFCHLAREAGHKIFADTGLRLGHFGNTLFPPED